jgi:hypothetical protein
MKRSFLVHAVLIMIAVLAFIFGCEKTFIGLPAQNKSPEVWLSSGPVEGTTTGYQVHFYWGGWDPDGEVISYEFVVVDGFPFGFHHEDTTGLDKWTTTALHDSIFRVTADDTAGITDTLWNGNHFTRYDKAHTFFIRAIDLEGKRSDPVYRSFTAWTLAPFVQITMPRQPPDPDATVSLGKVIKWEWRGTDPIDSPDNTQDPESIRYIYHQLITPSGNDSSEFDIILDLNDNPWRYEEDWSPWIYYRAPGDSGRSTWLGDDEILALSKSHIFAVQAKDEAGAVTAIFTRGVNVRQFIVSVTASPLLTITEAFLGGFQFTGDNPKREKRDLPPGVELNFRFRGDASLYGGEIVCFQYGWDVADLSNPSDWDSDCSPFNLGCTAIWYSGVHTLYVRCVDNSGSETLGQIEISVVPFTMDRNLLWVDDFMSDNSYVQTDYATPREDEHDAFWLGHCNRTIGFDPTRDVYDAVYGQNNSAPPKISLIGRYKNIIWTFNNDYGTSCFDDVVRFTPETKISQSAIPINFLAIFLAKGGHLLTEGRSDKGGGLAMILPPMSDTARGFPLNIKCEILGNSDGCEGDTSSVNSYAYKDYCVTMLDEIDASHFRTDSDMPMRRIRNYDCMYPGAVKSTDAWHDSIPGMPSTLDIWSEILVAGRYFAPNEPSPRPGGYSQVEVYDPYYWMNRTGNRVASQRCFHPMYRMKAKNSTSCLNNQTVALWVTKYATIVPDVASGVSVAAPSAHFGFELWFFNRAQVRTILNTIFQKWQILATP